MADLSIKPINTASAPVVMANSAPSRAAQSVLAGAAGEADKGQAAAQKASENTQKANESAKKDSERRAELRAREETAAKEYGPVVSRSGDGDTLRVKSDTDRIEAGEESRIYDSAAATAAQAPKPEVQNFEIPKPDAKEAESPKAENEPFEFPDEIKNQAAASAQAADQGSVAATNEKASQTASIKNASESELKRMYLQGDISSVQYNNEEKDRQEKTEALKEENNQFASEMTKEAAAEASNERAANAANALGSEDASESIPLEVREQFVQNMDFS